MSIQKHGCFCAQTCDLIYWDTHQRKDKTTSLTGARLVLWQVDVHSHHCRLGNTCKHYASVCHWSSRTQDYDAHVIRQVGHRSQSSVPRCNNDKSSFLERCHHIVQGHHHGLPSLTSVRHHRPSWGCSRVSVPIVVQVIVISCMAFSSLFCLTRVHVQIVCNVLSSGISSVDSWM